jgi:hypothetical protein
VLNELEIDQAGTISWCVISLTAGPYNPGERANRIDPQERQSGGSSRFKNHTIVAIRRRPVCRRTARIATGELALASQADFAKIGAWMLVRLSRKSLALRVGGRNWFDRAGAD